MDRLARFVRESVLLATSAADTRLGAQLPVTVAHSIGIQVLNADKRLLAVVDQRIDLALMAHSPVAGLVKFVPGVRRQWRGAGFKQTREAQTLRQQSA